MVQQGFRHIIEILTFLFYFFLNLVNLGYLFSTDSFILNTIFFLFFMSPAFTNLWSFQLNYVLRRSYFWKRGWKATISYFLVFKYNQSHSFHFTNKITIKKGKKTYLMQLSGSPSQSVLQRNRSHDNQPIGGVLARPFSRASILLNIKTPNIIKINGTFITVDFGGHCLNTNMVVAAASL